MVKKMKGALWSYFFRKYPQANSLSVQDVRIESQGQGKATLYIQRDLTRDVLDIQWTMIEGQLLVTELRITGTENRQSFSPF